MSLLRKGPEAPGVASAKSRLKIHLDRCSDVPINQKKKYEYYIALLVATPNTETVREKSAEKPSSAREVVWAEDIYMDCSVSSTLRLRLYEVPHVLKKLVCEVTVSISDVVGKNQVSVSSLNAQTGARCTFHFSVSQVQYKGSTEVKQVIAGVAGQTLESASSTVLSSLEPVAAVLDGLTLAVDAWQPLLDKIEMVMNVTEAVAEIHPYTKVAFSVISAGYQLARAQKQRDENVAKLIGALHSAYDITLDATNLTKMTDKQRDTLERLTKHIINCGHFIVDYAKRSFWGRVFSSALSSADDDIAEFRLRIDELQALMTAQGVLAVQRDAQIILGSMSGIADSVDLLSMKYSLNARWRSGKKCLAGTQTGLLSKIENWVHDTHGDAPRVLLLTGVAGVGKSSIAHTVAGRLQGLSRLGASYCFDRNDSANLRPDLLFPTIARHLSDTYPAFKHELVYFNSAATFGTTDLEDQFENLIKVPLQKLDGKIVGPVVFVVDGMDESASFAERGKLLSVLANRFVELPSNFRLFIISRPEIDVQRIFGNKPHIRCITMTPSDNALHDVRAFVDSKLVDVEGRPLELFSSEERGMIVSKSQGLFQWVYVVCTMIVKGSNPNLPPSERRMRETFERLIALPGSELDALYQELLTLLFPETDSDHALLLRLLGLVAESCEPLTAVSLTDLLQLSLSEKRTASHMLGGLGALLTGVSDENAPIRTLHTSFRDFLVDASRSKRFYVNSGVVQLDVLYGCLRVLNAKLRFNMCGLETSYAANADVANLAQKISSNVPASLAYAVRYWGHHAQLAPPKWPFNVDEELSKLLREKFLFWLELLSVLGAVNTASPALGVVCACAVSHDLRLLARDCQRFVRVFGQPILRSAPHVYLSALALAPRTSLVHQQPYSKSFFHLATMSHPLDNWPQVEALVHVESGISAVAFSPDGRRVASAHGLISMGRGTTLSVWDAETGALLSSAWCDIWISGQLVFSLDGVCLLCSSSGNTVHILNTETGLLTSPTLQAPETYSHYSTAFSCDGHRIAFGGYDGKVGIWDIDTGLPVHALLEGREALVSSLAFSFDGCRIVSGSQDYTMQIWDVETGTQVCPPLEGHTGNVNAVAFSFDGQYVVSGSSDSTIQIWDAKTGLKLHTISASLTMVQSVAFTPDDRQIITHGPQSICLWSIPQTLPLPECFSPQSSSEFQPDVSLEEPTNWINCIAMSADGHRVAFGSEHGTVRIWDVRSASRADFSPRQRSHAIIWSMIFFPDSRRVLFRLRNTTAKVWDAESGAHVYEPFTQNLISSVVQAFSPDGHWIVTGSRDGEVQIWDLRTGAPKYAPYEGHEAGVTCLAFSPNSRWIVSGSWDRTVRLWSTETGKPVSDLLEGHIEYVRHVVFSEDGHSIVSCSRDSVQIWNVETGKLVSATELSVIKDPFPPILALSPNGHYLLVYMPYEYKMKLLNTKDGALVHELRDHPTRGRFTCTAFSPNSRLVVTGLSNGCIQIWDAETGQRLCQFLAVHEKQVDSVVFSPDGCQIMCAAEETAGIWDLEIDEQSPPSLHVSAKPHSFTRFDPCEPSLAMKDYPSVHTQAQSTSEPPVLPFFRHNVDGWIEDVSCSPPRLLLWTLSEARDQLYLPLPSHLIIPERVHSLDLSNFAHGARWTECYQPNNAA